MATVIRSGRLAPGAGIAASAFAQSQAELTAHFGESPHPGTLNVLLRRPLLLRPSAGIAYPGSTALRGRGAWPVRVLGQPSLLVRWAWCPLHIAEIVSPVGFRAAYGLEDGARVPIELDEGLVAPLPMRSLVAWTAMWAFNRKGYLDDDYVRTLMETNPRAYRLAGQPVLKGE